MKIVKILVLAFCLGTTSLLIAQAASVGVKNHPEQQADGQDAASALEDLRLFMRTCIANKQYVLALAFCNQMLAIAPNDEGLRELAEILSSDSPGQVLEQ